MTLWAFHVLCCVGICREVGAQASFSVYNVCPVGLPMLEELEQRPSVEDLADKKHAAWTRLIGRSVVEADKLSATMRIGDIFRSEIILMP